jgi:hypothetical protein
MACDKFIQVIDENQNAMESLVLLLLLMVTYRWPTFCAGFLSFIATTELLSFLKDKKFF